MHRPDKSRKLWVLLLGNLANLFTGFAWMSMPVLFHEISQEMGWGIVELLTAWGMISLGVLVSDIPAGILSDRIGVRWSIGAGLVAFGMVGAARGFAPGYFLFMVSLFVFGCLIPLVYKQLFNATVMFFDAGRLGVVHGTLQAMFGVACATTFLLSGTLFSPALGGWQNLFYLFGACSATLGLAWMAMVREPSSGGRGTVPGWRATAGNLYRLIRNRTLLMFGLIYFLHLGAWIGASGTLPTLLKETHGFSPQSANGIMALASWSWAVGALVLSYLSDYMRDRRHILMAGLVISGLALFLLCIPNDSGMHWFLACLWGFSSGCAVPVMMFLLLNAPGVDRRSSGTAIGMVFGMGSLGGFIYPMIIAAWIPNAGQPTMMVGIVCGLLGYTLAGLLVWKIPPGLGVNSVVSYPES